MPSKSYAYSPSDPNDTTSPYAKTVDICVDGDGTVIRDERDATGAITKHCTEAMKDGKPRFVDGISVELNFGTSPIKGLKPPTP